MSLLPKKTRLSKDQKEIIAAKHNADIRLNFNREHPKEFKRSNIEKVFELQDSDDDSDILSYLLLTTGRRPIEVLSGKFKVLGDNMLSFVGQRKSTGNHNIDRVYKIFTLDDSHTVLELINHIQNLTHELLKGKKDNGVSPLYQVTNSFVAKVARRMKKILPEVNGGTTTPKELRKLYALLVLKFKPEGEVDNEFIESQLGHESLGVSLAYQTVKII